jgi:hypothetical protein
MIHGIFQLILLLAFVIAIIVKIVKGVNGRKKWRDYEKRKNRVVPQKIKTKEEREADHQELLKQIETQFNNYYENLLKDKDFINKATISLEDYIINPGLNEWDLHKLAQLNNIKLEMGSGWYDLTIELMVELDKTNWNRKVGSIKEKYGELRFYADSDEEDLLDEYTERSKTICEICGKEGELDVYGGWYQTLCTDKM